MQWKDDRQIHIHTVLHQNKNDEHARGPIGTELNTKAACPAIEVAHTHLLQPVMLQILSVTMLVSFGLV